MPLPRPAGSGTAPPPTPTPRANPSNLSPQTSFFLVREDAKAAVLLHLLRNVVRPQDQTVVFVATKHHAEYLSEVSRDAPIPSFWSWGPAPTPAPARSCSSGFGHQRAAPERHLGLASALSIFFNSLKMLRKISGNGKGNPLPIFLPGEFHGLKSLVGYSPWGCRVRHD